MKIATLWTSPVHWVARTCAASSIQRMTTPPCTFPPQLTSVGAARKRRATRGAVPASVYSTPAIAVSTSARRSARRTAQSCCSSSPKVAGTSVGTGVERPSASTATNTMRQRVAGARSRVRGGPDATSTVTCIEERPVCTTRAVTSTRSPTSTGRVKRTLPTYAVTQ